MAIVGMTSLPLSGQLNREPDATKGVEVVSKLGDMLELDTRFHDDRNHYVRLGDFFEGNKPVILSFNYSNCPKLCSVQLENMTLALGQLDFSVGEDFEVVSISIDPLEQASRAKATKQVYTKMYNRRGSEDGFHFLVADPGTAIPGPVDLTTGFLAAITLEPFPDTSAGPSPFLILDGPLPAATLTASAPFTNQSGATLPTGLLTYDP